MIDQGYGIAGSLATGFLTVIDSESGVGVF
jgi:hypothetical protein